VCVWERGRDVCVCERTGVCVREVCVCVCVSGMCVCPWLSLMSPSPAGHWGEVSRTDRKTPVQMSSRKWVPELPCYTGNCLHPLLIITELGSQFWCALCHTRSHTHTDIHLKLHSHAHMYSSTQTHMYTRKHTAVLTCILLVIFIDFKCSVGVCVHMRVSVWDTFYNSTIQHSSLNSNHLDPQSNRHTHVKV